MQWFNGENKDDLRVAAEWLRQGKLVAFPTETVYGLGANGLDPEAVQGIYRAKGRPSDNPLILHIYEKRQAMVLAKQVSPLAEQAMDAFWPGPLTLVLPRSSAVPNCVTGGMDTVAVRMPNHPVARALLRLCKVPIAAPSANLSGRPSPTTAQHVFQDLDGRIDGIVDGGAAEVGLESTVVDMTGVVPIILRPGGITKEMLEERLGCEVLLGGTVVGDAEVPKAPGMKYRHYAPKGTVVVCQGTMEERVQAITQALQKATEEKIGLMLSTQTLNAMPALEERVLVYCLGETEEEIAHRLFDALRWFDDHGAERIYAEDFGDGKLATAIMNRLNKAAGEVRK